MASPGASCRRTRPCTCIRSGRSCWGRARWWWAGTTTPTWSWRWTTPRTFAGGSSGCTRRGAFRRYGWRCRITRRRAAPKGRRPGLTIHLLEGSAYRESPVSRAFPGWRAGAVHQAMNEVKPSGVGPTRGWSTWGARSGRGTAPGRTTTRCFVPMRNESRAEGRKEGLAEGREKRLGGRHGRGPGERSFGCLRRDGARDAAVARPRGFGGLPRPVARSAPAPRRGRGPRLREREGLPRPDTRSLIRSDTAWPPASGCGDG